MCDHTSRPLLSACFLIKKNSCVYVGYMHVFYVGTQVYMPVHVEARGLCGCVHIYGGLPPLCILGDKVSHQTWVRRLAGPVGSACFHALSYHVRLLWGSQHGPPAFKTAILLMESSLQSTCSIIFKDETQVPPETEVQVQANFFKERFPVKHPIPLC